MSVLQCAYSKYAKEFLFCSSSYPRLLNVMSFSFKYLSFSPTKSAIFLVVICELTLCDAAKGKRRQSACAAESLEFIPHIRIWNSKLAIERIFRISLASQAGVFRRGRFIPPCGEGRKTTSSKNACVGG